MDADLFIQTIGDKSEATNVNVKISYSGSNENILLFGKNFESNSVTSVYENKYISW